MGLKVEHVTCSLARVQRDSARPVRRNERVSRVNRTTGLHENTGLPNMRGARWTEPFLGQACQFDVLDMVLTRRLGKYRSDC